jgi:hypothetical protein
MAWVGVGAALQVHAAIEVSGLNTKTVYTSQAGFQILPAADHTDLATLNGQGIATGEWITVDVPDYYELKILREPSDGGAAEELTVQFIVRDPDRGNSEWGLRPWTPGAVINGAAEEFANAQLRLLAPSAWPVDLDLPLVAWAETETGEPVRANGQLVADGFATLQIRRGVGSVISPAFTEPGTRTWTPLLHDLAGPRTIEIEAATTWTPVAGVLTSDTEWPVNSRIDVTGDLTIPADASLTVGAGSVVRMAADVEWHVAGTLMIHGTAEQPVVLTPASSNAPWGGITCRAATSRVTMRQTILTGSGADPDWFDNNSGSGSSHRDEQPALYLGAGAQAVLEGCCFIDNQGQATHGEDAFLTLNDCLIQRCITVGQFNGGEVTINRSALIEFPVDSDHFQDDDNDALYLTDGTHRVTDSLIGWAKDDGIDSGSGGGGSVRVERCWIEACYHEGLAWSGGNRVTHTLDTVLLDCGQGIEAGWSDSDGSPDVTAERCLILANGVGARFGDNYDWSYDGFLQVQESLVLHNHRDVWGMNWDDWTYRVDRMAVQGNHLTRASLHHPDNELFDPQANAERLRAFLPSTPRVGAGIAWRRGQATAAELRHGVPVRLSRWADEPTSVNWNWLGESGSQTSGTLEFAPGEIQKQVPLPETERTTAIHLLQLSATASAEITGSASLLLSPSTGGAGTLVPPGATWSYLDDGSDQGTAWREPGFDDSAWASGPAQLGYGDGDEATEVAGGPSGAHFATTYFRHAFEVGNPAAFTGLDLGVQRDDGAIVWLNGAEIFRTNMPDGEVAYDTYTGNTTSSESTFYATTLDPALLRVGRNLLAVEVHQAGPTSSDVSFDLELVGKLRPRLNWAANGPELILYWFAESAALEIAPSPSGPWESLDTVQSPFLTTPQASRFYQLRQPR